MKDKIDMLQNPSKYKPRRGKNLLAEINDNYELKTGNCTFTLMLLILPGCKKTRAFHSSKPYMFHPVCGQIYQLG